MEIWDKHIYVWDIFCCFFKKKNSNFFVKKFWYYAEKLQFKDHYEKLKMLGYTDFILIPDRKQNNYLFFR